MSLAVIFAPAFARGDCPDQWYPVFGVPPGTDNTVRAATTWDPDGSGPLPPQAVIGGDFTNAGGNYVNRIARFDGVMWLPFGTGPTTGLFGIVRALTTWDPDGPGPQPERLIAGGDFVTDSATTLNHVALWNGTAWQALDAGLIGTSATVSSLVVWDPDGPGPLNARLVAGGTFTTTPGGATVSRVAMWDGAAWQSLGNGFANGNTLALTVYDPDGAGPLTPRLAASGNWTMSGATTVKRVAWWDGSAWQPFASGVDNTVVGLTAWDPDGPGPQGEQVVATGNFLNSGSTPLQFIARWDGSAWQTIGLGVGSTPNCVGTWDPDGSGPLNAEVVVGGDFSWVDGHVWNRLAGWNGTTWHEFGLNSTTTAIYAMTNWDPDGTGPMTASPLIAGTFVTAGTRTVSNVANWQNESWRQLGSGLYGSPSGQVRALATWDPDGPGPALEQMVAGGDFTIGSGKTVNRVARFDGQEWQTLGGGVSASVTGLTAWDPDGGGPLNDELVAVGQFNTADGVTVRDVAHFDGTQWRAFGNGIGGFLNAVTVWDTDGPGGNPGVIVVGGNFNEAAGAPGNRVAMWNGTAWQRMDNGFIDQVLALATFSPTGNPADSRVYAGGQFGSGGAPPFQYIARWNGAAWQSLNQGVDSLVRALTVLNGTAPELVVGGAFSLAAPTIANRAAAWTGSAWASNAFEPGLSGMPGVVYGLTTWDSGAQDTSGPQVIAGGNFTRTTTSATPALNNIARWSAGSWQPLGLGTNGIVEALTTWDPDGPGPQGAMLVAGGAFTMAGGLPEGYISAIRGCGAACNPIDANCDGAVNLSDVPAFASTLLGDLLPCSSCSSDANADGLINGRDIPDFMAAVIQ